MIKIYIMRADCLPEKAVHSNTRRLYIQKTGADIVLAEEHWQRIEQCANVQDRKRRLMGCLLAAYALKEYRFHTKEEKEKGSGKRSEWELPAFSRQKNGKPVLAQEPGFYFNISHSGEYAVCAVSEASVGIDIQQRRPVSGNLAQRVLSDREQRILAAAGEKREEVFFRLWCAKEAYIKYTGQGMRQAMQTFSADLQQGRILTQEGEEPVKLIEMDVPGENGYRMSVCGEEEAFRLVKVEFPIGIR